MRIANLSGRLVLIVGDLCQWTAGCPQLRTVRSPLVDSPDPRARTAITKRHLRCGDQKSAARGVIWPVGWSSSATHVWCCGPSWLLSVTGPPLRPTCPPAGKSWCPPTDLAVDVEQASGGIFSPEPRAVYARWEEFCAWAHTADFPAGQPLEYGDLGSPSPEPGRSLVPASTTASTRANPGSRSPKAFLRCSRSSAPASRVRSPTGLPEGGHTDWEVELVVVIGREARDVTRETRPGRMWLASRPDRTSPSASRNSRDRHRSSAWANPSPDSLRSARGWSRPTTSPIRTT